MSDDEIKRLQLATRLHGATMPVIEMLMTTDGAPTLGELHVVCGIAERVERAGDVYGTTDELFTRLLFTLVRTTEEVRAYVDERMRDVIAERAARADPEAVLKALEAFGTEPPQSGDEMPPDVADAVEQRLQQLADAGGRIVLDVGDLTESELEMIADSEIPPELRWHSTDGLQRDPAWSDDEYDARRQLHENGGRVLDVASLPIEDVRRLNSMREIDDLLRGMPLDQLERARDAVRDVDIQSRIGTRSQFDEIEEQVRREEAEYDPAGIEHLRGIEPRTDRRDEQRAWADAFLADDDGLPPHMIELFERLADTPYDLAAVDAAAQVYAAAVDAAGGEYGHALAAVWRAWQRGEAE